MSSKLKNIIDYIQWLLIIILFLVCALMYKGKIGKPKEIAEEYKENIYNRIYESQRLSSLKKENEELYRIVDSLSKVENAIEIRYKYVYKTDTVFLTHNSITLDSVYHYTYDNDTIAYKLDIAAKELKWHKTSFEVNSMFRVVNANEDNTNKLYIQHSDNIEISGVDAWHKKKTFFDHISYGPSIGVGYGLVNNKFDLFVGASIGYSF